MMPLDNIDVQCVTEIMMVQKDDFTRHIYNYACFRNYSMRSLIFRPELLYLLDYLCHNILFHSTYEQYNLDRQGSSYYHGICWGSSYNHGICWFLISIILSK